MGNNNVTNSKQIEEKALMNERLKAHQSDYEATLDLLKSFTIRDNSFHHIANNFPVTMQLEYMAQRAIYFKNIPLEIKSGINNCSKEEDLLVCIQSLLRYLFKDADREYYVFDIEFSEIAKIVKDFESSFQ
jgi:ABC-type microcin C transport system permease subunit YejB